jgi:hypothetical protein
MGFKAARVESLRGECEAWREIGEKDNPDFENSWVNNGATQTAGFYKDKFDRVWLKGLIKNGTVGAVPAFTLPVGYRPDEAQNFSGIDATGTPSARIFVDTDGHVEIRAGNNGFIGLDGFSWRV